MSLEIKTYEQTTRTGVIRTIYTTTINKTTYQTDNIEKLNNYINNHVDKREGTF